MLLGGAPGDMPVLLAPATAGIAVASRSKAARAAAATRNKQIAMGFVHADRETQTGMLKNPDVARVLLQTLSETPQLPPHGAAFAAAFPVAQPLAQLQLPLPMPQFAPVVAQLASPAMPGVPLAATWSGPITLTRNMGKRLQTQAVLVRGTAHDVEVALQTAAGTSRIIDITHRVSFDEVVKRAGGTLLAMMPSSAAEQAAFDEYCKYFRSKMRAGVAKLDEVKALYVLPPSDDVPALRDSIYAEAPALPRAGCLLGLIAPGTTAGPAGAAAGAATAPAAAPAAPAAGAAARAGPRAASAGAAAGPTAAPAAARKGGGPAAAAAPAAAARGVVAEPPVAAPAAAAPSAPAPAPAEKAAGQDPELPSDQLLDLFSNPELIKLLSDGGPGAEAS